MTNEKQMSAEEKVDYFRDRFYYLCREIDRLHVERNKVSTISQKLYGQFRRYSEMMNNPLGTDKYGEVDNKDIKEDPAYIILDTVRRYEGKRGLSFDAYHLIRKLELRSMTENEYSSIINGTMILESEKGHHRLDIATILKSDHELRENNLLSMMGFKKGLLSRIFGGK
jgi:hypothetical protein